MGSTSAECYSLMLLPWTVNRKAATASLHWHTNGWQRYERVKGSFLRHDRKDLDVRKLRQLPHGPDACSPDMHAYQSSFA